MIYKIITFQYEEQQKWFLQNPSSRPLSPIRFIPANVWKISSRISILTKTSSLGIRSFNFFIVIELLVIFNEQ